MNNLLKRPNDKQILQQINYTRRNIQMAKNYETDVKTVNHSADKASEKNAMDSQNCGKNSSKNSSKNSYNSKNSSKSKASGSYNQEQDSPSDRY